MGVGVAQSEVGIADEPVLAVIFGHRSFEAVEAGKANVAERVGIFEGAIGGALEVVEAECGEIGVLSDVQAARWIARDHGAEDEGIDID